MIKFNWRKIIAYLPILPLTTTLWLMTSCSHQSADLDLNLDLADHSKEVTKKAHTDRIVASDLQQNLSAIDQKRYHYYSRLIRPIQGKNVIKGTIYYGFLDMISDENPKILRKQQIEGSYDTGPEEKMKLKKWMLEPCQTATSGRCGFKVSSHDDDILEKDISLFNIPITLQIRLRSVTKDPYENASIDDPFLIEQGELWEKELLQSMKEDSLIMILSHSRHGGGPDPFYPRINDQGKIRYVTYYEKRKRGVPLITQEYAPPGHNQILVVGACNSDDYFKEDIDQAIVRNQKTKQEFLFLGTQKKLRRIDFDVATEEILTGLSLGELPEEMSKAWKNPKGTGPDRCFKFNQEWKE